ncbi:MAG TPA: ribonuclease H-like domain-containing protein [Candidatus Blautia stercorigallinarum]|uniref:Ribonuclease H-like domain-containing protein n=1 Tax=Candidatus Blautia stercorigallinarum TaxID=2838501 RepID=A0A9D1TGI9_9FIRM|nr:ribonuclease H-like domain-containing protein [Candidatus Blautia stercorigallinarum]
MITTKEILCQENINIDKGFFPEEMCLEDTLFFDIETTGLSPGNSRVFLIGIITKDREDPFPVLLQFLAEENTENQHHPSNGWFALRL